MPETLKRITPEPLWRALKLCATALRLRPPRVMLAPRDVAMLEKWGRNRRSLVEIGVFEGGSALRLRRVMDPAARLALIDPFVPDSVSGLRGSYRISRLVVNRCRRGQVEFFCDYSFNVAKTWGRPLDFLFIDGDHSEQGCRQDFDDWETHVQPGGIILFHDARCDCGAEQPWMGAPGSTAVVNRLFRQQAHPRWRIVDEGGSIVAVERR
jgi:predicted O-methyltransferase YrrM